MALSTTPAPESLPSWLPRRAHADWDERKRPLFLRGRKRIRQSGGPKIIFSLIPGKPAQYVGSQPADSTTAKTALSGKLTDCRHARDEPWRSTRQARNFMGREDLV